MKRSFFLIAFGLMLLWACQAPAPKNQVTMSGPEVDNVAKQAKAFVDGDWDTFRAAYADTAKAHHNNSIFTVDSLVSFHRNSRANWEKVEFVTYAIEYVKYEDGNEFSHIWGLFKGTAKGTGKVVEAPVHIACMMAGGKIGTEYAYYDTAPLTAAIQEAQAAATTATPK